jgi:hypothetical protein
LTGVTRDSYRRRIHPPLAQPTRGRAGELGGELDRFRTALRAAGLREATVHSYMMASSLFVRWLAGEYVPGPGRAARRSRNPERV